MGPFGYFQIGLIFLHIKAKQPVICYLKFFLKIIKFTMWYLEFLKLSERNNKKIRNLKICFQCDETKGM